MEQIIFFIIAGAMAAGALAAGALFHFSRVRTLKSELKNLKAEISDFKLRYETNPSYDCQLFMADILSGKGLFKIERLERENLFYLRR